MARRIIFVDNFIGNGKKNDRKRNGYIGMNKQAAKKMGIKYPYSDDTFLIYRKMPKDKIDRTIRHEEIEDHLLKKGWDYRKKRKVSAHDVANELEDNYDMSVCVRGSGNKRGYVRKLG